MAGKVGAPFGNKNAAGRGGARTAVGGLLLGGPLGSGIGTTKNDRGLRRHTRTTTVPGTIGGILGATAGTSVLPIVGTAIGGVSGAAIGDLSNYAGTKIGQTLGKKSKEAPSRKRNIESHYDSNKQ